MSSRRIFLKIADFAKRRPVVFGCAVSAVKTSGSDLTTQCLLEHRDITEVDWRRNSVFFLWGCLYLGGVQYYIYCVLFARRLFPTAPAFVAKSLREKIADRAGQVTVIKQVALDQFVHHPFVLFPAFYQVKEFIEGGRPIDGFRKFKANCIEDLMTCWTIWIPAFLFNFSFCPMHFRVPFVAGVSFFFTCILSRMRGAPQQIEEGCE